MKEIIEILKYFDVYLLYVTYTAFLNPEMQWQLLETP